MDTIDAKTAIIDIISTVGADKNVAGILIYLASESKWND